MLNIIPIPTVLIVIKNPESLSRDQAVSSSLQGFSLLLSLLPREAVNVPFLTEFKARLDRDLSNLVYWEESLSMAGELEIGNL